MNGIGAYAAAGVVVEMSDAVGQITRRVVEALVDDATRPSCVFESLLLRLPLGGARRYTTRQISRKVIPGQHPLPYARPSLEIPYLASVRHTFRLEFRVALF